MTWGKPGVNKTTKRMLIVKDTSPNITILWETISIRGLWSVIFFGNSFRRKKTSRARAPFK
jgi:hypothetical protein